MGNCHICVCICTYKRQQYLEFLLKRLQDQRTDRLFTYSIIVVDNDHEMSAKSIVNDMKKKSSIAIDYYVEPEKNIALARNKAIQNANSDFVAFIDDDEFPVDEWLLYLYKTYNFYKADGVLGPVMPHFEERPPEWIQKGKFCERPAYETGTVMHWRNTRTGNVLLSKNIFKDGDNVFNPAFKVGGEDVYFFKEMIDKGYVFIWCNDANVYEMVPPTRCKKSYFLRRAFLSGNVSLNYFKKNLQNKAYILIKSVTAFSIYTLILPFTYFFGIHIFLKYLIKDINHISRLLALFGIVRVKKRNL